MNNWFKPIPEADYSLSIEDFSKKYLDYEFICPLYNTPVILIGYKKKSPVYNCTFIVGGDIKDPVGSVLEASSIKELTDIYTDIVENYIILSKGKFKYYGIEFKFSNRNYNI